MKADSDNGGVKIRNYSITAFFATLTIIAVAFFAFVGVTLSNYSSNPVTINSECTNTSANVFIRTSYDIRNVKCVSLDGGLFDKPEIVIGDISANSEEVCIFKSTKISSDPLRFEIFYNGKAVREVCNWQAFSGLD